MTRSAIRPFWRFGSSLDATKIPEILRKVSDPLPIGISLPRPYAYAPSNSLERGDVTTIADLARAEGISDRYVSRVIRLAWLSPSVLERLVLRREPTVLSIFDLCGVAELPWVDQPEKVFD